MNRWISPTVCVCWLIVSGPGEFQSLMPDLIAGYLTLDHRQRCGNGSITILPDGLNFVAGTTVSSKKKRIS